MGLIGWDGRQVTLLFPRLRQADGTGRDGSRLLLATRHQLFVFADAPSAGQCFPGTPASAYDALYLPRVAYFTGDLNVHDVAFGAEALWMVATRFPLPGFTEPRLQFRAPLASVVRLGDGARRPLPPQWVGDGRGATQVRDRVGPDRRGGGLEVEQGLGGVVVDVETNTVVLRGLSMPHSPRLHEAAICPQLGGRRALAGRSGDLPARCRLHAARILAGPLPGRAVRLVGLSMIRETHIFGGLPVQTRHPRSIAAWPWSTLRPGREVGRLDFTSGCTELFDVCFLPASPAP